MEKTNVIVGGSNVEGNIGSCEVRKTEYSKDSWNSGVILQDSCTGKIVGQYEYYDWSYIYFPLVIIFVIGGIGWIITRYF